MFTHQVTRSWARGSDAIVKTFSVAAGAESNLDEAIPTGNNNLVAFQLDVSQCLELFMVGAVALTVKTNSSGSPDNTFTLAAGVPFSWVLGDPPLRDTAGTAVAADITALYVSAVAGGLFQLRSLSDPTV